MNSSLDRQYSSKDTRRPNHQSGFGLLSAFMPTAVGWTCVAMPAAVTSHHTSTWRSPWYWSGSCWTHPSTTGCLPTQARIINFLCPGQKRIIQPTLLYYYALLHPQRFKSRDSGSQCPCRRAGKPQAAFVQAATRRHKHRFGRDLTSYFDRTICN